MRLAPMTVGEVRVDHVSRTFGELAVLTDVSIRLAAGMIAEIGGDNGAGKTSLLRILAGTLTPTTGTAVVCSLPPGNGMASLVPAGDRALYWRLTGRQELEFFARIAGVGRNVAAELAKEASAALQVEHLLNRRIGSFSTGQRRRFMVARSLVGLAPVLLLDEPYADLDDTACEIVEAAVRSWVSGSGLAIWTSPTSGGGPRPDARFRIAGGILKHV